MLVAGEMDSFLLQPSSVDMGRNIVVVFDRGDESLKAVDRATGQLRWELGRSGQGPWEFAGVTDIAMGPADSVWVLDADNRRVYVVGPDGSQGRVINVADALAASEAPYSFDVPYRMAVLPDGFVLGLSRTENGLAAVFSADGRHRATIGGPTWVGDLTYMAADYRVDGDAKSGNFAAVFQFTGRILAGSPESGSPDVQELEAVATADEPEIIHFEIDGMAASRLAPGQVRLARSIAVEGDRILILSARQTDDEWVADVIDVYENGDYLYSIRLPAAARRIAASGNTIATLETEMLPTIRELVLP
ncbi:MAG: hypothetical protein F4X47_03045 [Gammaproteobacteria bacterium]|nr:hypothetical protein [Gammaproteobacteria bacterium]MYC51276.1 hypothetical protein [Gammaproteobacteria bacterium]